MNPTPHEAEILAKMRELPPTAQAMMKRIMEIMLATQDNRQDSALFHKWLDNNRPGSTTKPRSYEDRLRVLQSGAWRDEARRMERRRVLKMAGRA